MTDEPSAPAPEPPAPPARPASPATRAEAEALLRDAGRLRFEPSLEAEFRRDHAERSHAILHSVAPFGVAVVLVFCGADVLAFDERVGTALAWRVGLGLPAVAMLALLHAPIATRIMQQGAALATASVAVCIPILIALAEPDDLVDRYYFSQLCPVILTACTMVRLRFVPALAVCAISLAAYEYVAIAHQGMLGPGGSLAELVVVNFTLLGTTAIGAFTAFHLEAAHRRDFVQRRLLDIEQAKAESLLLNILPEPISQRLKDDERSIADGFENVSVLFADIVGFTPLSESLSPEKVVALLNEVFSAFDDLAERHGLEKIKTIGDAYMVAAGIPEHRDDHAEAIAEMALDMVAHVRQVGERLGTPLELRVGINSGPVVAGVIGKKKFIYDLWGDTVNTAARMESHGLPGRIQVTAAAQALLRDRYALEDRGVIEVKGKGPLPTWFLVGRRDDPPTELAAAGDP